MSTNEKSHIEDAERLVKKFYNRLLSCEATMSDAIRRIVKKSWKDDDIFFSFGLECENNFLFLNKDKTWEKVEICEDLLQNEKNINLKSKFSTQLYNDAEYNQFFRCVGTWKNKENKENKYYYFCAVKKFQDVSNLYFKAVDEVYYRWLFEQISYTMNAVKFETKLKKKKDAEFICKQAIQEFQRQMLQLYHIDLEVITKLSGSYYEGEPCQADLVFQLSRKKTKRENGGLEFKVPVEVREENVRRIRKLLQMGKKGQYLLASWNRKCKRWEITGVFQENIERNTDIIIKIVQHMAWDMEINQKRVISYKCGEYLIDCISLKEEEFEENYEKTFKRKMNQKVKEIFSEAIKQTHGTILMILDKKKIEDGNGKILGDFVGIRLKNKNIKKEFIAGATSIDGAMCIDQNGKCYAIGMILDSEEVVEGAEERGARYNSSKKYIKKCCKNNISGLAVVVSEDKTVNFFSTEDLK